MQAKSFSARERAARRPENCIRAWRKHRGLTLERLAAILTAADHDIDAQRLSKLETRLIPLNHQEIALLAQALKCSETELLRLPPGSGALELTAEGTEHEISEGAAKVDLGFIALQLDRVLHERADFRDDVTMVMARLDRIDATIQSLATEVRAMHSRHERLSRRVDRLESSLAAGSYEPL